MPRITPSREIRQRQDETYYDKLIALPENRSRLIILLVLSILAALLALIFVRD